MTTSRSPQISQHDRVTLIQLGEAYQNLDEHSLEDLSTLIMDVAENADPPLVLLDLSHTKFFGSAFIELMFRAWNKLKSRDGGGTFSISGLSDYCQEVIQVTHLNRLWSVYSNSDEALESMNELKDA